MFTFLYTEQTTWNRKVKTVSIIMVAMLATSGIIFSLIILKV
jgi:hypothetical protein